MLCQLELLTLIIISSKGAPFRNDSRVPTEVRPDATHFPRKPVPLKKSCSRDAPYGCGSWGKTS